MRKITSLIIVFVLIAACFAGCSLPETAHQHGDLTITLPVSFVSQEEDAKAQGMEFFYLSGNMGICGIYEDKTELEDMFGELDAKEYAQLIVDLNEMESDPVEKDGHYTFTYYDEVDGDAFTYVGVIYETEEAFWMVQGYCLSSSYEKLQNELWKHLTSVTLA